MIKPGFLWRYVTDAGAGCWSVRVIAIGVTSVEVCLQPISCLFHSAALEAHWAWAGLRPASSVWQKKSISKSVLFGVLAMMIEFNLKRMGYSMLQIMNKLNLCFDHSTKLRFDDFVGQGNYGWPWDETVARIILSVFGSCPVHSSDPLTLQCLDERLKNLLAVRFCCDNMNEKGAEMLGVNIRFLFRAGYIWSGKMRAT